MKFWWNFFFKSIAEDKNVADKKHEDYGDGLKDANDDGDRTDIEIERESSG